MLASVNVRSVTVSGLVPALGDRPETVNYTIRFRIVLGENTFEIDVPASTADGYTAAAIAACDALREGAICLGQAAEREKTGPHVPVLFTSEDNRE